MMHFEKTSFLVSAVVLVTIWTALCHGDSVLIFSPIVEDTGYATNCGKVPFNFSWTPKTLSARHGELLALNYTLPYVLDGGFYNVTLTEYGESEPFLSYANPFTCDDIKKTAPCPIQKGTPINMKYNLDDTKYLLSFPGRYILKGEVKNKEGKQMLCAQLDVTIDNN